LVCRHQELKSELCTRRFLDRVGESTTLSFIQPWFAGNGGLDTLDRVLKADSETYLPNDLLVKVDIASMAVSLEARSPFLDHHLLEFAARLPSAYKLRRLTTKRLLKRALGGLLPPETLTRSKMGFGVPIGAWLRGELREFLDEAILSEKAMRRGYFKPDVCRRVYDQHQSGKRDWGHQLWTLLMLELWHQEFVD
jgi:asparagine synthase (glutamine-hydrolysing)